VTDLSAHRCLQLDFILADFSAGNNLAIMNDATNPALNPGHIVWIALIAFAVLLLLGKGYYAFCRALAGWASLTQHFPGADTHTFSNQYKCSGRIANFESKDKSFTIEIALEGLRVTSFFARKAPVLIPWTAIRSVSQTDAGFLGKIVTLTVDYEKPMRFTVPTEMLQTIQENVPADRFQKAQSLLDVLNERLHQRSN
jgi:hypothetical protein